MRAATTQIMQSFRNLLHASQASSRYHHQQASEKTQVAVSELYQEIYPDLFWEQVSFSELEVIKQRQNILYLSIYS